MRKDRTPSSFPFLLPRVAALRSHSPPPIAACYMPCFDAGSQAHDPSFNNEHGVVRASRAPARLPRLPFARPLTIEMAFPQRSLCQRPFDPNLTTLI